MYASGDNENSEQCTCGFDATQTCWVPGVGNQVDERARNAKCSQFGRFQCQAVHLPPTSLYTHILWHSVPCLLRVTLEKWDVTRRQCQPGLHLARKGHKPLLSLGTGITYTVYNVSFLQYPSDKGYKDKLTFLNGCFLNFNAWKHDHATQRISRVLLIHNIHFPRIYVQILPIYIYEYTYKNNGGS